jgi:type II secretory pathway pseudopilin PulG
MSKQNPILLAVVGAIVALGAFHFLILSPKREEASTLKAQIETEQQALTTAQQTLASYSKAKETYKNSYATVARLGKAVPEDDDVRSLMVQIDAAAKKTGVDFRTINVGGGTGAAPAPAGGAAAGATPPPGATVGAAGFVQMPFTFSFNGQFFKLSDFLSRLERFVDVRNEKIDVTGRLLLLDSIKLAPGSEGFPNIKAEIGATSFLLPPAQGLTAGATAAAPAGATPASTAPGATPPTAATTTATISGVK